jgi:hypothetical protein
MTTLNVDTREWIDTVCHLQNRYELAIGTPDNLLKLSKRRGKRWIHGIRNARRLYSASTG